MQTPEQKLPRKCILGLRPYVPGKSLDEVQEELGLSNLIKLASNENPLAPSPRAVEAMVQALQQVRLYPDNECRRLRKALSQRHGVAEQQIIVGRGSDEVIHMTGLAFLSETDEALMAEPPFVLYEFTTQLMGASAVRVPLKNYAHDLEEMARTANERTKLVFIANPDNPTGTIVRQRETQRFLDSLPPTCVVVFDEAYADYVEDPEFPDSLAWVREGRNAIVLRTFSKIYSLAGLRVGYGIAPSHLARYLEMVREPFNVSSVAQAAALASLDDEEQVKRSLANNRQGKEFLYAEFRRLGLEYVPTEANFIFADVGRDAEKIFELLMRKGVIVRPGASFGFPTHLRITIGTAEQNRRLVAALEEVLKNG
jgi:histidinol-phosphate aminotransferase